MEGEVKFLYCCGCGKCVSTGFVPVPTDTPDKGIIVRAYIECPECIEARTKITPPKHEWQFYMNGTFCKRCGAAIGSETPCR